MAAIIIAQLRAQAGAGRHTLVSTLMRLTIRYGASFTSPRLTFSWLPIEPWRRRIGACGEQETSISSWLGRFLWSLGVCGGRGVYRDRL